MHYLVIITFSIYSVLIIPAQTKYIIDIIDIEWNVTSRNNFEMFWETTQPSRGIFAVKGKAEFKEDINTDNAKISYDVYYSKNAITYLLTPFHVPPMVFTENINVIYRLYVKDVMTKCCENAIDFDDKFVPPIEKGVMICKDCLLDGSNFPSHLRPGFYKIVAISIGEIAFELKITLSIEYD